MIPIFLGNGNIIKRLLGQKLMVPLSKLCFGAYLIFPIVITLVYNTTDSALFLSITTILLGTLAIIVFCFLGGFGLYVFIQAPVANIVKLASDRITGCNINSLNHEPCLLDDIVNLHAKDINEKETSQCVKNSN